MDLDWIGFMLLFLVLLFLGFDSSGLAGEWMRWVWGGLLTSREEYEGISGTCHVIGLYDMEGGLECGYPTRSLVQAQDKDGGKPARRAEPDGFGWDCSFQRRLGYMLDTYLTC